MTKTGMKKKRYMVYHALTLIMSIFLCGCMYDGKKQESETKLEIVPMQKTEDAYYSERCKLLGIDNMKVKLDLPQIRIWTLFSLADSGKIVILKKNNQTNWTGEFCQYRFDSDSLNQLIEKSKSKTIGQPRSGWNSFLAKIKHIGMYNLNDSGRRKNYGLCNEGGDIIVEIVEGNKYFEYIYPCWMSIDNQTQINKIKSILELVEKEFGFIIFPIAY